jgi:ribonuclease P protein subunit RPR2
MGQENGLNVDTRQIARRRIHTLFDLAREIIHDDPGLAQHYVDTARKIAMATRVRIPDEYRRQVCKHCKGFMVPGVTCRVRLKQKRQPHVVITCLRCGGQTRIPLAKRKQQVKA